MGKKRVFAYSLIAAAVIVLVVVLFQSNFSSAVTLDPSSNIISGVSTPVASTDAANKGYVDALLSASSSSSPSGVGIYTVWGSQVCPSGTLLYTGLGAAAQLATTPAATSNIICTKSPPDTSGTNVGQSYTSFFVSYLNYYLQGGGSVQVTCAVCAYTGAASTATITADPDNDSFTTYNYYSLPTYPATSINTGNFRGKDLDPTNFDAAANQSGTIMYRTSIATADGSFGTYSADDTAPNGYSCGSYSGDKKTRCRADNFCALNMPGTLNCTNIHAWLSVNATDSMVAIPTNYNFNPLKPVYAYFAGFNTIALLANTWFFVPNVSASGFSNATWQAAAGNAEYWTGSNKDGSFSSSHSCNAGSGSWTNGDGSSTCNIGYSQAGGYDPKDDLSVGPTSSAGGGGYLACVCTP